MLHGMYPVLTAERFALVTVTSLWWLKGRTWGALAGLHVYGQQQGAAQLQAAELGRIVDVQRRQRGQRQRQAAHPRQPQSQRPQPCKGSMPLWDLVMWT